MNHCFISYSEADGLDFATRLTTELEGGYPFIPVWFEKQKISASGADWDDQLASAINDCKCLLFVMSVDSTAQGSNCKAEWTWALKYKKPVICLLIDNKAGDLFRLSSRQKIDFLTNFEAGIAKLRKAIERLDSPEGLLEELNHRLAEANRDLRRAKDDDKARIQAEIEELKKDIEIHQKIVDDPKAAEDQTKKNIEAGLERERQPEKPIAGKTETKFINPPPGLAPNYFQDRFVETKQIVDFLNNDSQRLMTIVGRAGVGKTAMICRLLKAIESGKLPDDLGEMKVDGIVYLSETGSHRVNFANVFADLSKLLSKETAASLESLYKDPKTSTGDKTRALLDAFPQGRVVLLLDNFENLVDSERLAIKDGEMSEALNALLTAPQHAVKAILTTRIVPRDLALIEPGRQHPLDLDDGLESPYAENVLREMDADGRVGLKTAPEPLLNKAREKTHGYPRALEALYAILSVDRYTTLEELLELNLPDEVVQKLVGEAFNRLDPSAQKVMQALAVYNQPVSPAAIDYLLQPHLPSIDSAPILQRLANMHLARKESGRFYLHPVDREYVINSIPSSKNLNIKDKKDTKELRYASKSLPGIEELLRKLRQKSKPNFFDKLIIRFVGLSERGVYMSRFEPTRFTSFNFYSIQQRAADYFAQARKPREEWKKLDDLAVQLAEFDLRCAAGDYDTAASVLMEIDSGYMYMWGHYRLMIDMHEKLQNKIDDINLRLVSVGNLGSAYYSIGKTRDAIKNYEISLSMARAAKNRQAEGVWVGNLGNTYSNLGDFHKAIELYEQALIIAHEIGDHEGEVARFGNLGSTYAILGDVRKAIESYEQALVIAREMIGDRRVSRVEGTVLNNLGAAYFVLGDVRKAIELYEQALVIAREIGDRGGEGALLNSLGDGYIALGEVRKAIDFNEQALVIAQETGDRSQECSILDNYGFALIDLNDLQTAIEKFSSALSIANEINKLLTLNIARGGLAQSYLFQNDLINARANIEAALQYDVPTNNYNATALHGIIALRQGERQIAQEAFTKSIAQADEILAKTPDYYDALDAKGLALSGLAICDDKKYITEAIETFHAARKIAPHAGVVKSMLRLFDELVKCDEEGILKDVRNAVEGK